MATPVSLSLDDSQIEALEKKFASCSLPCPNSYMTFFAQNKDVTISIYAKRDGFGKRKVVFAGENGPKEAKKWGEPAPKKAKATVKATNLYPQIGSDEVGTGDFFGPVCVCASYVEQKDLAILKELGVTDSKLMTDEKILEIGPTLLKTFDYSFLSLSPSDYNRLHPTMNMNVLKAKMHDEALRNVLSRHPDSAVYQDQFAADKLYYSYLKDVPNPVKGITFSTKGESLYPSVALASVIARYGFIKKMEELSKKYGKKFPYGASNGVTNFARDFLKKYGEEELAKVAKISFANYEKLAKRS